MAVCCFIDCIEIFLLGMTGYISNPATDIVELTYLNKWISFDSASSSRRCYLGKEVEGLYKWVDSLGYPVTNIMPYPALKARCNREIPRVQIEDLCEGCISLSIAEGLQKNCTKRSVPFTSIWNCPVKFLLLSRKFWLIPEEAHDIIYLRVGISWLRSDTYQRVVS